MRREITLTAANFYTSVSLDFEAVALVVLNPTPSPVFVRTGAPDIPSATNANVIVPSATSQSIATSGREFGLTISATAVIGGGSTASVGGLYSTVTVTFLSAGEVIPAFGSYNFLSLSVSPLTPGFIPVLASGQIGGPWDLGPWGGLMLYFLPNSGSGQGVILIEITDDLSGTPTWRTQGAYAFWPSVPVTITVPRVARYVRATFLTTIIAGEPPIGGTFFARATIAEIFEANYSQQSASISKPYNISPLGTQTFYAVTVGMPAVSINLNSATGSSEQLVYYVGPTGTGPWRRVTQREQLTTGLGASLYRSQGSLDQFLRVDILETSNVNMTGTFTLQVTSEADPTSILSEVLNALGTTYDPVSVDQNIYQRLKTLNNSLSAINVSLGTVITSLSTINTSLGTINGTLGTINGSLGTINSSIGTSNSFLSSITTSSINTAANTAAILTDTTAIKNSVASISTAQTRFMTSSIFQVAGLGFPAGVWQAMGAALVPTWYITHIVPSIKMVGGGPAGSFAAVFQLAIGPPGVPTQIIYMSTTHCDVLVAGGAGAWMGQPIKLDSTRSPGLQIPATYTTLFGMISVGLIYDTFITTISQAS